MKSIFILMGQFDSRTVLTLDEVCEAIGCAKQTAYNDLSAGAFPIPMRKNGKSWQADIRDVADYLDQQRDAARASHDALRARLAPA